MLRNWTLASAVFVGRMSPGIVSLLYPANRFAYYLYL